MKKMGRLAQSCFGVCLMLFLAQSTYSAEAKRERISSLDEHFNNPDLNASQWMFIPNEAIKEASTTEHPGLATIWLNGGKDIKGVLKEPIPIDKYKLPWEFQTSFIQGYNSIAGVGAKTQINYATGLNVAVTFSDPSTWPKDRTQMPPDTRSIQLMVVHVGSTGEAGVGLPQYSNLPHPENYMVWGRGDLGYTAMGDWKIPFIWIGSGPEGWGPASDQLFFRCEVASPTSIRVGIKFANDKGGWNMRDIDCSKYGRITGIWEIGPIISGDRWIPDVLCRSIPLTKGTHNLMLGIDDPGKLDHKTKWSKTYAPDPEPPNPRYEYYVDYCVFFGARPRDFEDFSDDFDIAGYMGKWQVQAQGVRADTYTNPGHLSFYMPGTDIGTGFGPVGGAPLALKDYPPPWEIELSMTAPDDSIPWNYYMNWVLYDKDGEKIGGWGPGVENLPKEGIIRPMSIGKVKVEFEEEVPKSLLSHKPLYILLQCIDAGHVRMGFRADPKDSWTMSKVYDVKEKFGKEIGTFAMHCWSTNIGRTWKAPAGGPMYQRFLFDYVHYRYGLSTDK